VRIPSPLLLVLTHHPGIYSPIRTLLFHLPPNSYPAICSTPRNACDSNLDHGHTPPIMRHAEITAICSFRLSHLIHAYHLSGAPHDVFTSPIPSPLVECWDPSNRLDDAWCSCVPHFSLAINRRHNRNDLIERAARFDTGLHRELVGGFESAGLRKRGERDAAVGVCEM
jgi:hypothetical protein